MCFSEAWIISEQVIRIKLDALEVDKMFLPVIKASYL